MDTKKVIHFSAHNHPDFTGKLIPIGTESNFYNMDGTKVLNPPPFKQLNPGNRSGALLKKDTDVLYEQYEFFYEVVNETCPPVPPKPVEPKAEPKKSSSGIKPHHVILIIVNAFVLCLLLVFLLGHNRQSKTANRNYLTFNEVLTKLNNDGYRVVESRWLNANESYAKTIRTDTRFKIVGSNDFMFRDGSKVPNEIIVKGNELVDVGSSPAAYSLKVRGITSNTRIALLYKMDNGIDLFKIFTKRIDAIVDAIIGFVGILFWLMVIALAVVSFIFEIILIYRAFFGKAKEVPQGKCKKPEPKKAPAKC